MESESLKTTGLTKTQKRNMRRTKQRAKYNEAATKIQATARRNLVINSMKPTTKANKLIVSFAKSKIIYKKKENEQNIRLQLEI